MENNNLTLGSLFDGSGGFPLGGLISGITPLWASEVEPFPIRVTTKRLPQITHYGDVSKLSGAEVPPVDIITFGSPCQDMSVAGKRSGLDGERSSLFYQAVRIVKEMRCKTNGKYPRFVVWENVPGAFSSNKGEDFKAVLESLCKIKSENYVVPPVEKGKWDSAGNIVGEDFSIAWRVFDAQYWGVPQRRKRIYLVADFTGQCAGKILFESEGVSGYPPKGICPWQGTAGDFEGCTGAAGTVCLNDQGGNRMDVTGDLTCTLRAESNHPPLVFENHSQDTRYTGPLEQAPTVSSTYGTGGNNQPFVLEIPKTFKIRSGCDGKGALIQDDLSATLAARDYKDPPIVNDVGEMPEYIVRRLTPTECARLQGFPDCWCSDLGTAEPTEEEIKWWAEVFETHRKIMGTSSKPKTEKQIIKWLKDPHSDSAEYKMWGNGVALPNVVFVLSGIAYYAQNRAE